MRASEPFLSTTSQTLSELAATPPSAAAGPMSRTVTSLLDSRSMRANIGESPHNGTQRLPKPVANPAQGSPRNSTVATRLFVLGSILCTANGPVLPTQTASEVIVTQSAVFPRWRVAVGLSSPIDLGVTAVTTSAAASAVPEESIQAAVIAALRSFEYSVSDKEILGRSRGMFSSGRWLTLTFRFLTSSLTCLDC